MSEAELLAYEAGLMAGIELGRRQAEDEYEAVWANARETAHQTLRLMGSGARILGEVRDDLKGAA